MTIAAGDTIDSADVGKFRQIQTGVESVSFTNLTAATQNVVFPDAFSQAPNVHININSGSGSTSRWVCRAIAVSATGFQIFVFSAGASTGTWSGVAVAWTAIARD